MCSSDLFVEQESLCAGESIPGLKDCIAALFRCLGGQWEQSFSDPVVQSFIGVSGWGWQEQSDGFCEVADEFAADIEQPLRESGEFGAPGLQQSHSDCSPRAFTAEEPDAPGCVFRGCIAEVASESQQSFAGFGGAVELLVEGGKLLHGVLSRNPRERGSGQRMYSRVGDKGKLRGGAKRCLGRWQCVGAVPSWCSVVPGVVGDEGWGCLGVVEPSWCSVVPGVGVGGGLCSCGCRLQEQIGRAHV